MSAATLPQREVTQLLCDWRGGDGSALEKLIPLVQPELQRLAHRYMARERPGHTLQTTALLDDAYLKLADKTHPQWRNRAHFFAVAAQLMRRIMVDHARQRQALKRGGGAVRITLDDSLAATTTRADELLGLDEALEKLAAFDKRKSDVVEMRYFGGLSMEEIAEVLKVHVNNRDARLAGGAGLAPRHPQRRGDGCHLNAGARAAKFLMLRSIARRKNATRFSRNAARAMTRCGVRWKCC